MTVTSHHALQLAHAAGMLSALVQKVMSELQQRAGLGEEVKNYLEGYHISLPLLRKPAAFFGKIQGLPPSYTPTISIISLANKGELSTIAHLLYKFIHLT